MTNPQPEPRLEQVRQAILTLLGAGPADLTVLSGWLAAIADDRLVNLPASLTLTNEVLTRFGALTGDPDEVFFTADWPNFVRAALLGLYGNGTTQLAQLITIAEALNVGQDIGNGDFSNLAYVATALRQIVLGLGNLQYAVDTIVDTTAETNRILSDLRVSSQAISTVLGENQYVQTGLLRELVACCGGPAVPENPAPEQGSFCGEWVRCTEFVPAQTVLYQGVQWEAYTPIFPMDGLVVPLGAIFDEVQGRRAYYRPDYGDRSVCFGWNLTGRDNIPLLAFREATIQIGGSALPPLNPNTLVYEWVDANLNSSTSFMAQTYNPAPPIEGDQVVEFLVLITPGTDAPTALDYFIGSGAAPS